MRRLILIGVVVVAGITSAGALPRRFCWGIRGTSTDQRPAGRI